MQESRGSEGEQDQRAKVQPSQTLRRVFSGLCKGAAFERRSTETEASGGGGAASLRVELEAELGAPVSLALSLPASQSELVHARPLSQTRLSTRENRLTWFVSPLPPLISRSLLTRPTASLAQGKDQKKTGKGMYLLSPGSEHPLTSRVSQAVSTNGALACDHYTPLFARLVADLASRCTAHRYQLAK